MIHRMNLHLLLMLLVVGRRMTLYHDGPLRKAIIMTLHGPVIPVLFILRKHQPDTKHGNDKNERDDNPFERVWRLVFVVVFGGR
jgi:hypothetical protein